MDELLEFQNSSRYILGLEKTTIITCHGLQCLNELKHLGGINFIGGIIPGS